MIYDLHCPCCSALLRTVDLSTTPAVRRLVQKLAPGRRARAKLTEAHLRPALEVGRAAWRAVASSAGADVTTCSCGARLWLVPGDKSTGLGVHFTVAP